MSTAEHILWINKKKNVFIWIPLLSRAMKAMSFSSCTYPHARTHLSMTTQLSVNLHDNRKKKQNRLMSWCWLP